MLLYVIFYGNSSHACIMAVERKIEDVAFADAVFVGGLVKYEVVKPRDKFDLSAYAILTFDVEKLVGGDLRKKRIQIYWHNSTFGMPENLTLRRYLVAITTHKQPPSRGPSAVIFASQRLGLISVLQAPCAEPFLLEPTEKNVEQVRNVLKKRSQSRETK